MVRNAMTPSKPRMQGPTVVRDERMGFSERVYHSLRDVGPLRTPTHSPLLPARLAEELKAVARRRAH
jgi:hypothetical protein